MSLVIISINGGKLWTLENSGRGKFGTLLPYALHLRQSAPVRSSGWPLPLLSAVVAAGSAAGLAVEATAGFHLGHLDKCVCNFKMMSAFSK